MGITTTRQTLDKYANIKHEYQKQKQVLRGKPVSPDNKELLSYLQKDVELAEKVLQLEAQLAVAHSEIGKLHAFIQKLSSIGKTNPSVMDVFQKTLRDISRANK
ncbi:transposase [Vibrio sp. JCM 19052]|nr:transposase [Vibrio sp. JCM 19052]